MAAGLINSAVTGTEEKDVLAPGKTLQMKGVGYDPEKRGVTADETVSGQLDKVLAADSPVLQRARAGAMQTANSRGLLNSSMAAGAGEAAVIDAALPIASADAGTYNLAARENQSAGNTALQAGADATNKASVVNTSAAADLAKLREQGAQELGIQTLRGEQAKTLANIEASYKGLIQASSSASDLYKTMSQAMAAVLADTNTTQTQKQSAVDSMSQILQSGLNVIGAIGNVDITGLLNFSA